MLKYIKIKFVCHSGLVYGQSPSFGHPELVSGSIKNNALNTVGSRNKFGMTNESGRSMIEMLGVLAVIGVLSVGGIAGYTSAMNKHRANELLHQASMRATSCVAQIAMGNTPSVADFGTYDGYTFTASQDSANNQFSITISGKEISETVCHNIENALPSDVTFTSSGCGTSGASITLTYEDGTGTSGSGEGSFGQGNPGATEDEDGAICSGTRPGVCSVCRKNYVGATSGEWFDSDALCTTTGETCVDGTCVETAADEPSIENGCKCIYDEIALFNICGNGAYCSTDADCTAQGLGSWDENTNQCVVDTFCTNNGDCTSNEYCHYTFSDDNSCNPIKKGTCVPKADAKGTFQSGTTAENDGFIRSAGSMSWFNAQNFCRSYGKNLATLSQLGLGNALPSGKTSCEGTQSDACNPVDLSAIRTKFGNDFNYWTANIHPTYSCYAYFADIIFYAIRIDYNVRSSIWGHPALCR